MTGPAPPARYETAAAPVLADLAAVGFAVDDIRDLRNLGIRYQAAIPVLVRWLPVATHDGVRGDIVHALGVPWAPAAAPALVAEFRRAAPGSAPGRRWSIASALADAAHDGVFDDIAELARDSAYGSDREMLALALGRMSDPRAVDVLLELATDDQVCGHAAMALGRLQAPRAAYVLRELSRNPRRWVRREAAKALKRLDR
jgi:HEAT repeat protein